MVMKLPGFAQKTGLRPGGDIVKGPVTPPTALKPAQPSYTDPRPVQFNPIQPSNWFGSLSRPKPKGNGVFR